MVWYVPPLSPIQWAAQARKIGHDGEMPDVRSLSIPLSTSPSSSRPQGRTGRARLERMLAMRAYMRKDGR